MVPRRGWGMLWWSRCLQAPRLRVLEAEHELRSAEVRFTVIAGILAFNDTS